MQSFKHHITAYPVISSTKPALGLQGHAHIPGDKSMSHRALIFGAISIGTTEIHHLLTGDDVLRTAQAFRQMGVKIITDENHIWHVQGVGLGGLAEPDDVLDMGNSGTAARLMLGLLSGCDMTCFLTGDASLRSRPMGRVIQPLSQMGAQFRSRSGHRLPLLARGQAEPIPIIYKNPVASAQVKSAILFAGLSARGATTVIEPTPTRDHTENSLRHFGAEISITSCQETGGNRVTIIGQPELQAPKVPIKIPSDPSSAAFFIVAASIIPNSDITMTTICLNPSRTGIIETLLEMGADIKITNQRLEGGEQVGDLHVRSAPLQAAYPPAARAPSMIDEYPILAVAAAFAEGVSYFEGVEELRVKESDRLEAVATLLRDNGISVEIGKSWMKIHGQPHNTKTGVKGGAHVKTHLDHRIAMSALVLGLAAQNPVEIDDGSAVETSFPSFYTVMENLGADIRPAHNRNGINKTAHQSHR